MIDRRIHVRRISLRSPIDPVSILRCLAARYGHPLRFFRAPGEAEVIGAGAVAAWDLSTHTTETAFAAVRDALSSADDPDHAGLIFFQVPFESNVLTPEPLRFRAVFPAVVYRRHDAGADVILSAAGSPPDTESIARELEAAPIVAPAPRALAAEALEWNDAPYMLAVQLALQEIARGRVQKVVVARREQLRHSATIDAFDALQRMVTADEATFRLLAADQPGSAFLSLTPERLCRVRQRRFESMALAGTTADDPANTLDPGDLTSDKNRVEHAHVVRMIHDAASAFCSTVHVEEPRVLRLAHLRHLLTPVRGTLKPDRDFLHAVAALHPTPAVAGTPTAEALRLIAALEHEPRGLFAGTVGWMDALGNGDAAVALRSAWISGTSATLFAGAGIVAGSDPAAECAETRLKLRSMLRVLGYVDSR